MTNTSFLTVNALNNLFEQTTQQAGLVFWIRSLDYQEQLYVSPNFQNYWGWSCNTLYQHPSSWIETLVVEDRIKLERQFTKRACALAKGEVTPVEDTLLFRVHKSSDNSTVYIRDKAFRLINKEQQAVAIAGIGLPIELGLWQAGIEKAEFEQSSIEQGFILFIQGVLKLSPQPLQPILKTKLLTTDYRVYFDKQAYNLTLREAQCLYYSLKGYSAKLIAKQLNLSHRTIETYIEHTKIKLKCRNKFHLLGGIDISSLPLEAMNL